MIYIEKHKTDPSRIYLYGASLTKGNINKIKKHYSYRPKGNFNRFQNKYEFKPVESKFDTGDFSMGRKFLQPLAQFLKDEGIPYQVSKDLISVNRAETVESWYSEFLETEFNNAFKPYPHQKRGIFNALARKDAFLEIATSGGKSFIAYAICSILNKLGKRCLIVTDTAVLVNQLKGDFISYSANPKETEKKIRCIHTRSKDDKNDPTGDIFISTYKSMSTVPPEYFKKFDVLIVDEAHKSLCNTVQDIVKGCSHCEYTIAMSGKIKSERESEIKLTEMYGTILSIINAKALIERDMATPLEINITKMRRPARKFESYEDYISHICKDQRRIHYIVEDALREGENIILLFNRIEMGENLFKAVKEQAEKKKKDYIVEYIDGNVPVAERDRIKELFKHHNNVILVASYKTIATGVNAPNLRGIALAEPFKAELTIVQAIGRTIRLNKGKEKAVVYDYADSYGWGFIHLRERMKTYTEEGHSFEVYDVLLY